MKIIIVGAGVVGTTSAYFLAKEGHDVTVIERQDGPALETSFANAGMLTPSMADPWNSPGILKTLITSLGDNKSAFKLRPKALPSLLTWGVSFLNNSREQKYIKNLHRSAELAWYSLKLLDDIRENMNLNYDQITTGSIKVFRDKESLDELAELSEHLRDHGMTFDVLYGEDLLKVEPSLEPVIDKLAGGVYFPDDQAGNAYKFSCEIEKEAVKLGAKFRYGVSVEKLMKKYGNISSLRTSDGDISADKYVISAGSFSAPLAKTVGLNIPVRPAKGYSISVPLKGWNGGPRMPIIDDGFHAAISPLGNVLRIAGTAEFAGLDSSLTQSRLDNMYNLLEELYPDFAPYFDKDQVTEWAGLRPLSVDGSPYIGKTKIDNLYVNTGHGPLGWTMAAGSAKLLTDIISGNEPDFNPATFNLDRS
ncbi:D-amino acid dehydrogenase [Pseudemcibacter aquimaris]|uniref:D-amino acid dehydrogenase n=1 Tax=Pseudemcibacter aquimaris TaxID=2857064 RepID=UPI00201375BA|nr:D-amino acid dehydrogenase [Pseudemcibacter aquimaris]MCC3861266.1 D-amino acid dehydrogenase [Pseudemcibacter aquimaris]WDU58040.1 D-amino acid dehydrogenase [Pseudemcibacter aquimaris]